MPARPDANLINAVAQGRVWFDQLKHGKVGLAKDLAAKQGTDRGNVTRTLRLAFLAPDIVKAILEGRQPAELTASSRIILIHGLAAENGLQRLLPDWRPKAPNSASLVHFMMPRMGLTHGEHRTIRAT